MANHHGDFIWYELMTPDPAGAEAFYGPMLGWSFGGDSAYRIIGASEGEIGGLLALSPEMTAGGAHPGWLGYVMVEDVDQAVTSIEQGGGKSLMPARDVEGAGRIALVADPQDAPFYVMKPKPPEGGEGESLAFSYDRPRLGHCAWNELATPDPEAAKHFYGQRFGWVKDGEMDMGEMGAYEFLRHTGHAPDGSQPGQGMLGAVMPLMPGMPAPAWSYYFRVADIDAAVEHVDAQGGAIVQEPIEIPGGDFSMVGRDPQGAHFALVGARKQGEQ